jgi:TorA maturation chaperone TorD
MSLATSAMKMKSTMNPSAGFDPALNMARQAMYRFAALGFLDPQAGSWDRLNALRDDPQLMDGAALIRSLPEARPAEIGVGESPIEILDPRLVLDRLPDTQRALNAQYESAFGLLVSSDCPPYETEYINSKYAFQRSNTLADISGFYRAFGLTPTDGRPERADHIVLELEFMATLLGLERRAAEEDSEPQQDRRQVCRDAQARFLQEHLAWWIPAFHKLLAKVTRDQFYAATGAFVAALIPTERAFLAVPPASQLVGPTTVERPELCEGCELAG